MTDAPRDLRIRILDAAALLFAQQGYGSTSVRQVVEAVGCTKPALYYHFGSKEALYHEVVRTRLEAALEVVDASVSAHHSLRDQLTSLIQTLLQRANERPLEVRLLATAEHGPATGDTPQVDLLPLHVELLQRIAAAVAAAQGRGEVRPEVDALHASLALMGMVHIHVIGALYKSIDSLPPLPLPRSTDVAAVVVELFFSGVAPKE